MYANDELCSEVDFCPFSVPNPDSCPLVHSQMPQRRCRSDHTPVPTRRSSRCAIRVKSEETVHVRETQVGHVMAHNGSEVTDDATPDQKKEHSDLCRDAAVTPDSESAIITEDFAAINSPDQGSGNDLDDMSVHEVSAHELRGFCCHVCDRVFTRKYHLERHLQLTQCSGHPPPGM